MTRQSQKNEEVHFAQKAGELLGKLWCVEESPDENEWPDLIISDQNDKFGLEVRSIFKDEGDSGSSLRARESIRVSCLSKLAETYYKNTDIPISLKINGDIEKSEIDNIASFLRLKVEHREEQGKLDVGAHEFGVKLFITRLPMSFVKYSRWKNVGDYVGWVSEFMLENLENAITEKESKLEKYRKNISDIRLLLVLNRVKNSGRAELPDSLVDIESKFNEVYVMLYPEKIYRVKNT